MKDNGRLEKKHGFFSFKNDGTFYFRNLSKRGVFKPYSKGEKA